MVKAQLSLFFSTTLRGGRRPRKSLHSTRLANFSFFVPTTPTVACKRVRPTPCPAPQPIRADRARCAHRKTDLGSEGRARSGVSHRQVEKVGSGESRVSQEKVGSELSIDTTNARGRTKHSTFELQHEARKPLERFRPQLTEYSRSVFTKTETPASLDRRKDSRPPAVKLYLGPCPRRSTVTSRLYRPCRDSQSLHSRLRTVVSNA